MLELTSPTDLIECLQENPQERTIGAFDFDGHEGLAVSEVSLDADGFPRAKVIARVLERSPAHALLEETKNGNGLDGLCFNAHRHDWSLTESLPA